MSDPEHQLSVAVRELAVKLAGQMLGPPGTESETATQQAAAVAAKADADKGSSSRLRRRSKS